MNTSIPSLQTVSLSNYTLVFRVVQSSTALIFHSVSLYLLLRIIRRFFKSKDVSLMLRMFLIVWIIEDLLAIPYGLVISAFWRPVDVISYYPKLSLYVVLPERSFSSTIPVAVFFLTLDRCLALLLGARYRSHHGKITCAACSLIMATLIATALYFYVAPELMSAEQKKALDESKCKGWINHLDCFFNHPNDQQFWVRIFFGGLNLVTSVVFFVLLRMRHSKQQAFTQSKALRNTANTFIAYATSSEILLNFMPHFGCLVYELVTGVNIGGAFGTYSRLLTSLDAVICAGMYYYRM